MKENSSNDRDRIMKQTSSLFCLNPFLDEEGILRVGGRLTRASVPFHVKHLVILPLKGHITALVINHYHQRILHQGRGMTLNKLCTNGFWITAVARHIYDCLPCRKLCASPQDQKMADLPKHCLEPSPPFTHRTRYISIHPVRILRTDQGTNLMGARNELFEAVKEINQDKVREFLLAKECDWIEFQTNVPPASHMCGNAR
ncbi:Hypothetical predicted protein [Paramuricea clavata]|uniref:Uncharacterized protein n=1 Tax=Paramuricea clavata TaxID=317549 RepID=A0A6S7IVL8_PARCT|nr:Hypothetical predicted protein [Paramuricea clavata]